MVLDRVTPWSDAVSEPLTGAKGLAHPIDLFTLHEILTL